jgi:hypothetical protein
MRPTQKSPGQESGPSDLPNKKTNVQGPGDAEMDEPVDEQPEITEDDFFYALAARDLKQAAAVLRSLGGLSREASENLADLLEGNPKQEKEFQEWFPYRFELRRWRPGKPASLLAILLGLTFRSVVVSATDALANLFPPIGHAPLPLGRAWSQPGARLP